MLAIDEPEVHLYPYMQRSIINYYKRILDNKENDFLDLMKYCFDIDKIEGQLFIVTHSTDALIDDYRCITRFYKENTEIKTVSGSNFLIDPSHEKQLLLHFPDIKEAFFSKCALIVEGSTEYGAMKKFSEIIGTPLDEYCISLINANGESSISKIKELLAFYKIPSVVIYDKDVQSTSSPSDREFYTNGICFEMDVVDFTITCNQLILKEIIDAVSPNKYNETLQETYIKKGFEKLGHNFSINPYIPKKLCDISITNIHDFVKYHFAVLFKLKGIIIGRTIGEKFSQCNDIPPQFRKAIEKAVEIVGNSSV